MSQCLLRQEVVAQLYKPAQRLLQVLSTVEVVRTQHLAESSIDYEHYLNKQIQPIADSILVPLGESFAMLTSPQQKLF